MTTNLLYLDQQSVQPSNKQEARPQRGHSHQQKEEEPCHSQI